jgi:nucleoside phosphorylase
MQMLSSFESIRFSLMVGIGGAAPKLPDIDIRLGDIVVSMPTGTHGGVMQYDYGKKTAIDGIERKGMLNKPPRQLLNAIAAVRTSHFKKETSINYFLSEMLQKNQGMDPEFKYQGTENDHLFDSNYEHAGGSTCAECDATRTIRHSTRIDNNPRIFYGLIGSGNLVWKESKTRDKLRDEYGILCFEMEAAGLMDNFPCLVIRGICDYADSHKNDRWQPYAAATAAAYAKNLLYLTDSSEVRKLTSTANAIGQ